MADIPVTRATDYLVCYSADTERGYENCETLKEAKDAYQMPPRGYRSIAICACVDGIPFARLDLELTFGRKPVWIYRPQPLTELTT